MAAPVYGDMGKHARDVFGKGYHFGFLKLDVKTKSASGVEFNSGVQAAQESKKVFGNLESKYKVKEYGFTFTEKWNTDNILATDITFQDQLAVGLKLSLDTSFAPQTGTVTGKLKSQYVHELGSLTCDVELDRAGPIVDGATVFKYYNWLAGYQMSFNTQKAAITKNNFALGYSSNDLILHTNVDDGQNFGGSIYQKVSENLDCGISLNWTAGTNSTSFGVGCKYQLGSDACIRGKVNNINHIGLGYQQKLRDGITLTLSALINGQNLNTGGHKVGVALEMQA